MEWSALGDMLSQMYWKKGNQWDTSVQGYKMYGEHRLNLTGSGGMLDVKDSLEERQTNKPQQVIRSRGQAEIPGL